MVLRAQPLPLTVVRELTLRLMIDDKTVDLTAPGAKYRYLYPTCPPENVCWANAVEAEIQPSLLPLIVRASEVKGEALGFPIRLTAEDQRALAELAARIGVRAD
jgi:hypothetical protein